MTNDDEVLLEHGDHVEVRQRLDRRWSRGFVVEKASSEGYVVRRAHDGFLVPEVFPHEDVRHEKRRFHLFRH